MSNETIPQAAHAVLAPSGALTWVNCPGSIQAQAGYPDKSSIYAAEGTAAHELAAMAMREDTAAEAYLGETLTVEEDDQTYTFEVTPEMVEYVQAYIDYVTKVALNYDIDSRIEAIEQKVKTTITECYGTSDYLIYSTSARHLHVFDLKYGKGHMVNAENNLQMTIYAWGAVRGLNNNNLPLPDNITMHICQPRLGHWDTFTVDSNTLWEMVARINDAAQAALDPTNLKRVPGEKQCQWCKAKGDCPELAAYVNDVVTAQFPILEKDSVVELAAAMNRLDMVKQWIKAVEDKVFDTLSMGVPVDGYKLVHGRSVRKWGQSEAEIEAELRSRKMRVKDITETKLLSVAQLEKKLGKQKFADKVSDLVVKPAGKPVIAKADDKRPAIQPSEQFEITESTAA